MKTIYEVIEEIGVRVSELITDLDEMRHSTGTENAGYNFNSGAINELRKLMGFIYEEEQD